MTTPTHDSATDDEPKRRGRPRQGRAVARHLPRDEEILKIAAEVFLARGFDGAKLDHIAEAAGIVKGSLYHYFDSKEDIFARLITQITDMVDATDEIKEQMPPEVTLRQVVHTQAGLVVSNPVEMGILARQLVQMDGDVGDWARSVRRRYLDDVKDLIQAGQKKGVFRNGDPTVLAELVLGSVTVVTEWYRPGGRVDGDQMAAELTEFIMQGMSPAPAKRRRPTRR